MFSFLSIIIMMVSGVFIGTFYFIGFTAVVAEENFSDALGNIFKVGFRYFLRILGVILIFYVPIYVFSYLFLILGVPADITSVNQFFNKMWIIYFIYFIYGILMMIFILTYSMKHYLNEKSLLETGKPFVPGYEVLPEDSVEDGL